VEVGPLHLLDDGDGFDTFGQILRPARRRLVSQWRSRTGWESFFPYIGDVAPTPTRALGFPEPIQLNKSIISDPISDAIGSAARRSGKFAPGAPRKRPNRRRFSRRQIPLSNWML